MSERPVFHRELGRKLALMREEKGWSQAQVADLARRRGRSVLTRGVLRYMEEGKTQHPDPDALRTLADVYGASYEELAREFFEANYAIAVQRTPEEIAQSLARQREREAQDDEEYGWLVKWRGLAPQGRKLAVKQVELLLEEFGAVGARPPSKAARRRAAS